MTPFNKTPNKPYEAHRHTAGRKPTPTYMAWRNMISRCTNPNRPDYKFYGARGITVCQRWLASFAAFLCDMGERPAGTSLDRINNGDGYGPNNCRWATKKQQMQNVRTNRLITFNGETLCLQEWAKRVGVGHSALADRLERGWTVERALTVSKRNEQRPRVVTISGRSVLLADAARQAGLRYGTVRNRLARGLTVALAFSGGKAI